MRFHVFKTIIILPIMGYFGYRTIYAMIHQDNAEFMKFLLIVGFIGFLGTLIENLVEWKK